MCLGCGLEMCLRLLRDFLYSRTPLVIDRAARRHHVLALPNHLLVFVAYLQRLVEEDLKNFELVLKFSVDLARCGYHLRTVLAEICLYALAMLHHLVAQFLPREDDYREVLLCLLR